MTPPADTPDTPYTLREAAERAGVSVSTIRRRRDQLKEAGAEQTDSGWRIPESALWAVFGGESDALSDSPADGSHDAPTDTPSDTPLIAQMQAEIDFLRDLVAQQARTIERQAEAQAVIEATRAGVTAIGASPAEPVPEPSAPVQPAPRRSFWQRLWSSSQ